MTGRGGRLTSPEDGHPCADGSLVHDFKGQSRCPSCSWEGLVYPANSERQGPYRPPRWLCVWAGMCVGFTLGAVFVAVASR